MRDGNKNVKRWLLWHMYIEEGGHLCMAFFFLPISLHIGK